jgi:predicted phosphodiesterase
MRVLASSDIHGNRRTYQWITGIVREWSADVIVLAGDLSLPVLYIMGNDDLVEVNPPFADLSVTCLWERTPQLSCKEADHEIRIDLVVSA